MESLKKPSLLGLLMANPIVIAIILIVLAVLFIFFYVTLAVLGLLTAAIFFVAGLGLVFIVASKSPDTIKAHPIIFFFTPIGLGLFGVLSDKIPAMSGLSLTSDIVGSATSPIGIAFLFVIIALVMLLVAYKAKGRRKRRRR
jgi:D-alanyl-lipoteichoic acid acyltransferase DltB (MBOAT superfamily)